MSNYISDFLRANGNIGKENGIKSKELLLAMGQSTDKGRARVLNREIQRFRRKWNATEGIETFIVSDTKNGYYLPSCEAEAEHFVKSQSKRAIQAFETIKELRKPLKKNGSKTS